ncbi:50S ribosomal protein L18 [Candidatus Pacearchaeota archaeon]|nr:50S ribosomal protein L18 [Candidatus Pacearchaeota archaeon]
MKVVKRRRKEAKTDYAKRIKLLKSNSPRLVFRKTNKYLIAQYVISKEAKDEIKLGGNSKELLKFGWPNEFKGSLKSISAAYLFGSLMSKKIKDNKLEKPIIDFGMIKMIHKTKTYAFLKGLKDNGLDISCDDKVCPDENRLKGEHMKNKIPFEEIKLKIEK